MTAYIPVLNQYPPEEVVRKQFKLAEGLTQLSEPPLLLIKSSQLPQHSLSRRQDAGRSICTGTDQTGPFSDLYFSLLGTRMSQEVMASGLRGH